MDLVDLLWNISQDSRISDVPDQVDRLQTERDVRGYDVRELAAENVELKLRIGLLVRLLIGKGVITAAEYASLLAGARPKPTDVG
ncbi:MAG TPA: hypothetical protein VKE40_00410 [Gemmataceae bacterium]|nr:hypothetical protein [Gemmataceae bacterium]